MPLTTNLTVQLGATLTKAGGLSSASITPTAQIVKAISDQLASGTGLDQADQIYAATRTISAESSETLDLAGSLTNDLGTTISFARVKAILVHLSTTTAGYTLLVGGNASNQFATIFGDASDKLVVRGGGFALLWAPDATAYAVTASTGDVLKIDNPNAGSVTYDIIIIGSTA